MQDKPEKCIVDSQGNAIKKDKSIKQFLTDNTNYILTLLLTSGIVGIVIKIVKAAITYEYAGSSADFYGADRRYFSGMEVLEYKWFYICSLLLLLVYITVCLYASKKTNSKVGDIGMFIVLVIMLCFANIKKKYEVIEGNRAIVSCYEGKFVVMDCKIQGETLVLNKGTYRLEEMTGKSIRYHQYEKVVCE